MKSAYFKANEDQHKGVGSSALFYRSSLYVDERKEADFIFCRNILQKRRTCHDNRRGRVRRRASTYLKNAEMV